MKISSCPPTFSSHSYQSWTTRLVLNLETAFYSLICSHFSLLLLLERQISLAGQHSPRMPKVPGLIPSALPKKECLARLSLLSFLLQHHSGASHLHLCMVGGALSHLETFRLQYTLYLSLSIYLSSFFSLILLPFLTSQFNVGCIDEIQEDI